MKPPVSVSVWVAAAALASQSVAGHDAPPDPEVGLGMVEIVSYKGYPIEEHYVATRDGYILGMFRIPHGKDGKDGKDGDSNKGQEQEQEQERSSSSSPRPVVYLQHGLFDSSWTWVSMSAKQSLGYILADAGFDVWFGNNRGNRYSRNHTTLDPDSTTDSSFWNFCWDQMASEDLPAMINYVTSNTRVQTLGYVGHSEGTIQMFAASATVGAHQADEYLEAAINKVNVFVALAPVAYVNHLASEIFVALAESGLAYTLYDKGKWEFFAYNETISAEFAEVCREWDVACDMTLMLLGGKTKNIDPDEMQVFLSEEPAGTSVWNMQHWTQGILTPTFQHFDFGSAEANMEHYGTATPPAYDLSLLTVPTAFFAGTNDILADPSDVEVMMKQVPADKVLFYEMRAGYGHMDFIWGKSAYLDIYGNVTQILTNAAKR